MQLRVVTPTEEKVDIEVTEVTLPGILGELGILPDHTPLMTALVAGVVRYKGPTGDGLLAINRGFAEILDNEVTLLVETAERPEEINVERAEAALKRAQDMQADPPEDFDRERSQRSERRARARIEVSKARS